MSQLSYSLALPILIWSVWKFECDELERSRAQAPVPILEQTMWSGSGSSPLLAFKFRSLKRESVSLGWHCVERGEVSAKKSSDGLGRQWSPSWLVVRSVALDAL